MGRIGMRKGLVAGFLLLIALVLAIAFQQDGPAKPLTDQVETPTSEPSPPELERISLQRESAPSEGASKADPEPDREPPTHFTVHVVDGRTGKAAPDQEVLFANWLRGPSKNFEETMRAQGRSLRTDNSGTLSVPLKGRALTFFVRKGNLVGRLSRNKAALNYTRQYEATLKLHPERAITVRVVDQEGNPVPDMKVQYSFGIEPTFSQRIRGKFKEKHKSEWSWRELGTSSDQDGNIEWNNLGDQLRELQSAGKRVAGIVLRVDYPGVEKPDLVLSPPPADGSLVELMLPILGELTIKLVDKHDRPLTGTGQINLKPLAFDREKGAWYEKKLVRADFEAGVAKIPSIALDLIYEVSVYIGRTLITQEQLIGPRSGEKDAERKLVCDSQTAFLRGRAVDASGQVLTDREIYSVGQQSGYHVGTSGKTDSQGQFLLALPKEIIGLELEGYAIRDVKTQSAVDLSLLLPIRPGIHELGDVTFPESVSLLRGLVVPAENAPCKNFHAVIEHRPQSGDPWRELAFNIEKDGGDFEIFGPLLSGTYRITIVPSKRCHLPVDPIEFVPGTRDMRIELQLGLTLAVKAKLPCSAEEFFPKSFRFYELLLRPDNGQAALAYEEDVDFGIRHSGTDYFKSINSGTSDNSLELHWNGLARGGYVLEAWIRGARSPFLVTPVFQVDGSDNGTTHEEIDLSTALKRITLGFRSESSPDTKISAMVRLLHEGRVMRWSSGGEGEVVLALVPGAFDAWILTSGYAPRIARGIADDRIVQLEASEVSLSVQLATSSSMTAGFDLLVFLDSVADMVPGWELPDTQEQELAVQMGPISPASYLENGWPVTSKCVLVDGAPVQVSVKRAGKQMLRLELVPNTPELRARMDQVTIPIEGFSPASIDLDPSSLSSSLRLSIPQSAIDEALRNAGLR